MSHLSREPLNSMDLLSKVRNPAAGALVLFSGEARNHNDGRSVDLLEYEAYESMADRIIKMILSDAKKKWNLHEALCIHRIGKVDVEQSAVLVATSASHRGEAFDANRYIIDRVKEEAPIWKKEHFSDGTIEWGANRPVDPPDSSS